MHNFIVFIITGYLQAAYVDVIAGEKLYLSLFEEDTEAERLFLLPEEELRMAAFKQFILEACQEMLQFGLEEAGRREAEHTTYTQSYQQAVSDNQTQSTVLVAKYDKQASKVS